MMKCKMLLKIQKPFKDSKEINKENQDDCEIIRDLRFLYAPKGAFGGNYVEYESNGDIDEVSTMEDYLNKIEPFNIINKYKDGWKIQLAAEITFSSVDDEDSKKILLYLYAQ